MPHQNPTTDEIREILALAKTIAIVGASSKPNRPSHWIMEYLMQVGYQVVPVNPREEEVLGVKCYPSLRDVPIPIDIVDVFRRAEDTPPVAEDAVAVGAKVLWLQQGILSEEAAATASNGGLEVIMDLCIAPTHRRLLGH